MLDPIDIRTGKPFTSRRQHLHHPPSDGASLGGSWGRARGLMGGAFMGCMMAQQSAPQTDVWGLGLTAVSGTTTVSIVRGGNVPTTMPEFVCGDGSSWESYTIGNNITIAQGETIYFRAATTNSAISSGNTWYSISSSATIDVRGHTSALIQSDGQPSSIPSYCFRYLFRNAKVNSAANLLIEGHGQYAYVSMFDGCAIVIPPAISDFGNDNFCYNYMFQECYNLLDAPDLTGMTSIGYWGAYAMFQNCTSLRSAKIGATSIGTRGLQYMFRGCPSLNSIEVAFSRFSWNDGWVDGVAANGTFICPTALGTDATITRGISACPAGWTVTNK